MQPQKSTSMTLALLASVCMMMLVASLFHGPKGTINASGLMSNFMSNMTPKTPLGEEAVPTTVYSLYSTPVSYLPR